MDAHLPTIAVATTETNDKWSWPLAYFCRPVILTWPPGPINPEFRPQNVIFGRETP